jgi:putative hydrolase
MAAGSGRRASSRSTPRAWPSNAELAARLEQVAAILDAQRANPFRVRAWRRAAGTLRRLDRPARKILQESGTQGLIDLPTIGVAIARAIEALLATGHLPLLDRLNGEFRPTDPFTTVPGIGPKLAGRIHAELGIETLLELEAAAWDGRLERLSGMGPGRVRAVRESLAGRFARPPHVPRAPAKDEPPVAELLGIDEEYRVKAARGDLVVIAPKRFNPAGEAWLPVLHAHRGPRHYTALYSNTARAHELGATGDWVVIYRDDRGGDGRWTVVTARFGPLRGRRIVCGREHECQELLGPGTKA